MTPAKRLLHLKNSPAADWTGGWSTYPSWANSTERPSLPTIHLWGGRPDKPTNLHISAPCTSTLLLKMVIQMIIWDFTMIKGGGGSHLHVQINGCTSFMVIWRHVLSGGETHLWLWPTGQRPLKPWRRTKQVQIEKQKSCFFFFFFFLVLSVLYQLKK